MLWKSSTRTTLVAMLLSGAVGAAGSNDQGTSTEPVFLDGRLCELSFTGTPSETSEFFAIWNLGHGIVPATFDTERPDLYAILPGTQHSEPGHPELDHDHLVSHGPTMPGYNGTWDVWVVGPGLAFDPSSYVAPTSELEMFDLIASGVLAGPVGFADAGFPQDLVLRAALVCRAR